MKKVSVLMLPTMEYSCELGKYLESHGFEPECIDSRDTIWICNKRLSAAKQKEIAQHVGLYICAFDTEEYDE